jgi:hypothetical protein
LMGMTLGGTWFNLKTTFQSLSSEARPKSGGR